MLTAAASIALIAITLPSGLAAAGPKTSRTAAGAMPPPARPGTITAGLHIQMTPAQASGAAKRCASWARKAGFAGHGRNSHLVTAVAIGMAESGCDASACFNNTTGDECTPWGTRHSRDSIDRGAWQINSHYWRNVSNWCAYRGPCSARRAYELVSADGTYFKPWQTYLTGAYRRYLPAARAAVRALLAPRLAVQAVRPRSRVDSSRARPSLRGVGSRNGAAPGGSSRRM
jgi:hypothetical protein